MKKILALIGVIIAFPASADPWSGKTKIRWLYPSTGGYAFSTQDYQNTELSSCDSGTRFLISIDHPNYNAMVSSLIMAFASDKEVNINIDGEKGKSCSPTINRMFVYK